MLKSKKGNYITPAADDELVAVKSDLVLLAKDPDLSSGIKKPRIQLVKNRTPSFHIDPEDQNQRECFSKDSTLNKTLWILIKMVALVCLLYFFVASLNLLASSFRLIGGRTASAVFQNSELLGNPVVGLMIGVLVTVVVQSSSTSSSIIVSMVAANFLDVQTAIPIIMGANIGTSVTNTLVSFGQINDREQFERAFAGATVHDMFNFLSVLVLLPLEATTGYLNILTKLVISSFAFEQQDMKVELLSKITKPLTNKIVKIDKSVLEAWSLNDPAYENATLLKQYCGTHNSSEPILCDHLAAYMGFSDLWTGIFLLGVSLVLLCVCLVSIVKILSSVLKGSVAVVVERVLNAELPYVPWLTGYIAILIGAVMTFLLQSSSIFTSSLTPLVGLGMISVERVYPLTLGSNLGTTTTALLAALASEGNRMQPAIQVALVHLFFNLSGMLLFYPIPFMRFPVGMAKALGKVTAKYRWFSVVYMVFAFIILPIFVFCVSLGGPIAMYVVFIPLLFFIISIVSINTGQKKCPKYLPAPLRSWHWVPKPLRSLEPVDSVVTGLVCCCCKKDKSVIYSPVAMHPTPPLERMISQKEGQDNVAATDAPVAIIIHGESTT
ncbi:Sodium-dependent phosphate transport protein 2B [Armadillidium vulgare]|nr:Sodium-dependent phosphate transport protein 2B [Armadillidium vulgare]